MSWISPGRWRRLGVPSSSAMTRRRSPRAAAVRTRTHALDLRRHHGRRRPRVRSGPRRPCGRAAHRRRPFLGHFPLDCAGPRCSLGHRASVSAYLGREEVHARLAADDGDLPLDRLWQDRAHHQLPWFRDAARALGHLVATFAGSPQSDRIVLKGEDVDPLWPHWRWPTPWPKGCATLRPHAVDTGHLDRPLDLRGLGPWSGSRRHPSGAGAL